MASFESLTNSQMLHASLHRDVISICKEACHLVGFEITKSAMDIIAELIYKKINTYGRDLEAFAKHGRRSTVYMDDVKLLVRRNPSIQSHLNTIISTQIKNPKEKRKKSIPALPNKKETPAKSKSNKEVVKKIKNKEDDVKMDDQTENEDGNFTVDLTDDDMF